MFCLRLIWMFPLFEWFPGPAFDFANFGNNWVGYFGTCSHVAIASKERGQTVIKCECPAVSTVA